MSTNDECSFYSANSSAVSFSEDSFDSIYGTLGDTLRANFEQSRKIFNVCHLNAQSVPSHHSDLLETFRGTNVHAILISESWLKPHLPSTYYSLPGFVLIRHDRIDGRGGGVAIYLRSDFSNKVIVSSPSHSSAEFLFLEVCVRGAKIALGVVYCPPCVNYFTEFESVLESLGSEYAHHIIMGDFNTDLSHQTSRSLKLLHITESANLHVLPLLPTHHNLNGEDTWLDLILTSVPHLASSHGQYPAPGFSHHDLIFLSYILKTPKSQPKVLPLRCFLRMDVDKLRMDAVKIDWDPLMVATNIDDKVGIFNDEVIKLYNVHAPVRNVKLRHPPAPWMAPEILTAMGRRDRAFRKFKLDRCESKWIKYKKMRNRCNQMIRNAKRRHILHNINSASSPADVWKFLGNLGIGKIDLDFTNALSLDDINSYFATTQKLDMQTKRQTLDYISSLPPPSYSSFHFSSVAADDIRKYILAINSNAIGCDNISRRMISYILDQLLDPLTHIFNFSLSTGQVPFIWRQAYVRPLPKISNPSLPNHFRPISILPFLSKVLEKCVHYQLSRFIHTNSILSSLQSGFRPGHSTVSALLKVTDDIRLGMEDTKITLLVLVDFSNAFNTVNHDILISILSSHSISSEALEWFSSYLRGRQQSVRQDEVSSNWCVLDTGVPQGGILSPLLFSLFIDFITKELQCSYHLYADDLQLYTQAGVDNITVAIDKMNQNLNIVKQWSDRFGLTINPAKCQAILIGSSRLLDRLNKTSIQPVFFDKTIIPLSSSVKNLGLYIDSVMNWRSQVGNVSKKVTGILRSLYRLKNFLPSKTKVMLVQTLILPIIDYGDVCYLDLNADLLDKLDRLLNNCIRFIYNLRKYDHVSTFRRQLKWLPIRQRRSLHALTTLYTLLNSPNAPSYLSTNFRYLCSTHTRNLRSSNNLLLKCPAHTSSLLHSSFHIQSILFWNALPQEIRMSSSRNIFKSRLFRHYFALTME